MPEGCPTAKTSFHLAPVLSIYTSTATTIVVVLFRAGKIEQNFFGIHFHHIPKVIGRLGVPALAVSHMKTTCTGCWCRVSRDSTIPQRLDRSCPTCRHFLRVFGGKRPRTRVMRESRTTRLASCVRTMTTARSGKRSGTELQTCPPGSNS
jgi:hypothetical protein